MGFYYSSINTSGSLPFSNMFWYHQFDLLQICTRYPCLGDNNDVKAFISVSNSIAKYCQDSSVHSFQIIFVASDCLSIIPLNLIDNNICEPCFTTHRFSIWKFDTFLPFFVTSKSCAHPILYMAHTVLFHF